MERYGPTEGCPVCTNIVKNGLVFGRVGVNHNDQCRGRITTAMRDDPQYRELMRKDQTDAVVSSVGGQRVRLEEQRAQLRTSVHKMKQIMRDTFNTTKQFDQTMLQTLIAEMGVAEFYSPQRIASTASKMGFGFGWSLDVTINDVDGRPWGFQYPRDGESCSSRIATRYALVRHKEPNVYYPQHSEADEPLEDAPRSGEGEVRACTKAFEVRRPIV